MGVNSLPKTVTRQCSGCDLNPGPSAPESSMLTTWLPSHLKQTYNCYINSQRTNAHVVWWTGWNSFSVLYASTSLEESPAVNRVCWLCATVDVKLNGLNVVVSMEYMMTLKDFFVDSLPPTSPSTSSPAPRPGQYIHIHYTLQTVVVVVVVQSGRELGVSDDSQGLLCRQFTSHVTVNLIACPPTWSIHTLSLHTTDSGSGSGSSEWTWAWNQRHPVHPCGSGRTLRF